MTVCQRYLCRLLTHLRAYAVKTMVTATKQSGCRILVFTVMHDAH